MIMPSNRYQMAVPALKPRGEIVIFDGLRAGGLRMGVSVLQGFHCMTLATEFIG